MNQPTHADKRLRFSVLITTTFPAVHCWPACPHEDVAFLRTPHRHLFSVTMWVPVTHADRDVEFIRLKRTVDEFIDTNYREQDLGRRSCEMIATDLLSFFGASRVRVMEDGENGAEVELCQEQ